MHHARKEGDIQGTWTKVDSSSGRHPLRFFRLRPENRSKPRLHFGLDPFWIEDDFNPKRNAGL
jgi:hypothetical protein